VDGLMVNGYSLSNNIRRYLFEKNNFRCEKCGWNEVHCKTGLVPLQVHHIDGNSKNNLENNLQLLCPNCHSLTENYGSRNKNATKGRSKYFGKK
jgi:5-methylcytosine-specific restriction endonuclease McrA